MFDARISSALNKIIQNSHFKTKVSLEEQKAQKEERFLRGRQIAFMIYDNFRVTGAHDTVLGYADLFSVTLRDDNVQEFDTRWDEVLLSMSKILSDDILESLYKLRRRGSDQLKPVFELYESVGILPNVNSTKTESGCKAGDKCLFPHCMVEEQPSKEPKKSSQNGKKRRQGCCSYCEKSTSIGLCLARLRAIRTSEKRESFGINSTGTIHTVYAASSKYPRK